MSGRIIYSSDQGALCPECGQPEAGCVCATAIDPGKQGVVRVSRETKGRKGKGVSLVTGVALSPTELADLLKALKKKCGCGGALKNGVIEIQGDHRDLLVEELESRGYRVQRAGG